MRLFNGISLLSSLLFCLSVSAQDTIILINGKSKPNVEFLNSDDECIFYFNEGDKKTVNNNGLMQPRVKYRTDVFEVILANGNHEVIYRQDSLDLTLPEADMTEYIHGARRGWKEAKNQFIGPLGFVLSGSGVFLIGRFAGPYWTLPVPFIYAASVAIFTPKVPEEVRNTSPNPYYAMGYQDIAKVKKIKSSTFWGIGGMLTGFLVMVITK